jgi:hypothetical protein
VVGTNRAGGIELSARRLAGRVTGSVSYSEGLSQVSAAGLRYPSSAERRRVLDATALLRGPGGLRLGTAFTAASGAPFTRFVLNPLACNPELETCADTSFVTSEVEASNANRAPAHVTLDLFGDWTRRFNSWSLSVFVQVRNVLNRRNAVTYAGSFEQCTVDPAFTPDRRQARAGICDAFDRGLPLLPLVGVSVEF